MSKISTASKCWEDLANAIIIQAANDYTNTLHRLKKHPDNRLLAGEQRKIERFFSSTWFQILCPLDGRALIYRLRREANT